MSDENINSSSKMEKSSGQLLYLSAISLGDSPKLFLISCFKQGAINNSWKTLHALTEGWFADMCNGVCWLLVCAFTSAPYLKRMATLSKLPQRQAEWRGVQPSIVLLSKFADFSISSWNLKNIINLLTG